MHSIARDENNLLIITYSGEVDFSERLLTADELCEQINNRAASGLLIDLRKFIDTMSKDEQVQFGKFLATKAELHNLKTAILHPNPKNPNLIVNAVSYSKGYPAVNFDDKREAIAWLTNNLL